MPLQKRRRGCMVCTGCTKTSGECGFTPNRVVSEVSELHALQGFPFRPKAASESPRRVRTSFIAES